MTGFDQWHDYWRLLIAISSLYCIFLLVKRFRDNRDTWNEKTRDYWFSLLMWTLAGVVGCAQGIFFNYPFGPSLVFTTAAVVVSLKGLLRKGDWGGSDT